MSLHPTPNTLSGCRCAANQALTAQVTEWVIVCPVCELDLPGYSDMHEAAYLATVHDHLHHGGRREAFIVPLTDSTHPTDGGVR
jgi:hypothetical protein